jgi:hypothetical protein
MVSATHTSARATRCIKARMAVFLALLHALIAWIEQFDAFLLG